MSFNPPLYEHRAYYVFKKATGEIVHSHRFLTIAGDDSVSGRFTERSIVAEASQHSGEPEAELDVLVEHGPPQGHGWISGVDVKLKKLMRAESPRPLPRQN